jgi:hypothetical protein
MSEQSAQRYCFAQDNDSHWYLIPADKHGEFHEWLEHESKLWGGTHTDEEFKRLKGEYKGEDFNGYRTRGGITQYTFENPQEDM